MFNKNNYLYAFIFLLTIAATACSSDSDNPADPGATEFDYEQILTDYADKVIVDTYKDLRDKAEALNGAVITFQATSTQANINASAEAWKATREPWESSEAFLFGPVAFLSIDPSLDSWPLDIAQLEEVLSSDFELTPEFIKEGLGFSLRGFHTIEYLLFRDGQPRNTADVTDREKEYLVAVTQVLFDDADLMYTEWINGYRNEFVNAGKSGSRYSSQIQAVQEIIEGITGIADEVGNGKISDPYTTKDVLSVESWFSWNSLTDFQNNIRSIQNAYTGGYHKGSDGVGLDEYVKGKDAALDTRVKSEINAAITAIDAIPHPYRNNLNADVQIQAAIEACNTVFDTFENDVKGLITN